MPPRHGRPSFEEYTAGLPSFAQVTAGLPAFEDACEGLQFPADGPTFDIQADPEVNTAIRLPGDLIHTRTPTERTFADYRKGNPAADAILADMPGIGASLHGVLCGRFALFEFIPALVRRTGQPIEELTLTTLSYSKQNAADMLAMLDAGEIKRAGLLISYFFKAQNRPRYDSLVPVLRDRGHPVLSMRIHSKLILARMADGTRYVVESSANLRSCDNVEIFVMTQCDRLYQFHHDWIHGLLRHGNELGKD